MVAAPRPQLWEVAALLIGPLGAHLPEQLQDILAGGLFSIKLDIGDVVVQNQTPCLISFAWVVSQISSTAQTSEG